MQEHLLADSDRQQSEVQKKNRTHDSGSVYSVVVTPPCVNIPARFFVPVILQLIDRVKNSKTPNNNNSVCLCFSILFGAFRPGNRSPKLLFVVVVVIKFPFPKPLSFLNRSL